MRPENKNFTPNLAFLMGFLLTGRQKQFIIISSLPMNTIAVRPVGNIELLMF